MTEQTMPREIHAALDSSHDFFGEWRDEPIQGSQRYILSSIHESAIAERDAHIERGKQLADTLRCIATELQDKVDEYEDDDVARAWAAADAQRVRDVIAYLQGGAISTEG